MTTKRKQPDSGTTDGSSSKRIKRDLHPLISKDETPELSEAEILDRSNGRSDEERTAALTHFTSKARLIEICTQRGLSKSGNKQKLASNIVRNLPLPENSASLNSPGAVVASSQSCSMKGSENITSTAQPESTFSQSSESSQRGPVGASGFTANNKVLELETCQPSSSSNKPAETLAFSSQDDVKAPQVSKKNKTLRPTKKESSPSPKKQGTADLKKMPETELAEIFSILSSRISLMTRQAVESMGLAFGEGHGPLENLERLEGLITSQRASLTQLQLDCKHLRVESEDRRVAMDQLHSLLADRGMQIVQAEGIIDSLQKQLVKQEPKLQTDERHTQEQDQKCALPKAEKAGEPYITDVQSKRAEEYTGTNPQNMEAEHQVHSEAKTKHQFSSKSPIKELVDQTSKDNQTNDEIGSEVIKQEDVGQQLNVLPSETHNEVATRNADDSPTAKHNAQMAQDKTGIEKTQAPDADREKFHFQPDAPSQASKQTLSPPLIDEIMVKEEHA